MISINNLTFSYKQSPNLFNELKLELKPGNVYGLLGKNGAGKTTLLKIICGLLYPDQGNCDVLNHNPNQRLPEMLKEIYIIPEEFYLPSVTINKYISANSFFYDNFSHELMNKLLKELDIPENGKLSNLSYGQKKKFLIAFGIATNVKILVFDEPTNGLDIPSKGQFRKTVASSITDDRCFIISTHQVRDLESLIDNIVIIEKGKIIFNYSVEKIAQQVKFKSIKDDSIDDEIIYAEDIFGGKAAIVKNKSNDPETKIELEILFNGVLANPEQFNEVLK
ncbi:ATP-binding cassette domain-containing protein [Bacteroidota bacterium]